MNTFKILLFIVLGNLLFSSCGSSCLSSLKCASPDSEVKVCFNLDDQGSPYYRVFKQDQLVIDTSYLGFDLNNAPALSSNFRILNSSSSSFDETWEQPWGEEQYIRNSYNELKLSLQEKTDTKRELIITFRVYDDGIGFRYEFPEQEGLKSIEVNRELTEFNLVEDPMAWWIPAFEPNRYEYLYQNSPSSEMGKVHTPVTFEYSNGMHLSIHEASLKDYSSMVINAEGGQRLKCELVPYSTDEPTKAFLTAPSVTPWRTIQLANNASDLVTSYLILNLNEPNKEGDVSWFEPGKYIGVWWELHLGKGTWATGDKHGANTENVKRYIDFAAQHGFNGVLVEGWNKGWDSDWSSNGEDFRFAEAHPNFDLKELSSYAAQNGVYLVGHHETGGNVDNYESQMTEAFQLYNEHDVRAVKTGYVEHGNLLTNGKYHHGQSYIDHFYKVIKMASQNKVAVVAHEPIKSTGERRTYPNFIAAEGARGQEFNAWSADGGNPPNHTTILPFTRCLGGPMDFTPGVFDLNLPSKPNNQVNTTLAKQLALYVVLYTPMQMACDLPEHYLKYPDAFEFIKEVGVDWETTKVLEAKIGQFITTARKERNTGDWFLGAITNENARTATIDLDFLDDTQNYVATIYKDGEGAHFQSNPETYSIETRKVDAQTQLTLPLAPGGGAAVSITPVNEELTMNE